MDDDFNTPKAISRLFEMVNKINAYKDGHQDTNQLSSDALNTFRTKFNAFLSDVLGLLNDMSSDNSDKMNGLMSLIIELRQIARAEKNWGVADKIRDGLTDLEIVLKDGKDGTSWTIK